MDINTSILMELEKQIFECVKPRLSSSSCLKEAIGKVWCCFCRHLVATPVPDFASGCGSDRT